MTDQGDPTPDQGISCTILAGVLASPPAVRELPSGDVLTTLEVTVRAPGRPAEGVPVAWFGAPGSVADWASGTSVVVVGRVRRRFFRAAGATASRTEVVAERVVPARRRTTARRAVQRALAEVEEALAGVGGRPRPDRRGGGADT